MIKRYENTLDLLESAFATYPDRPAYTCMGHTLTYKEVDELSARFASYLQNEAGLKQGERIAIQLPNILQFPIALYGALRAGLVVVNANPLYTSRELKHQLIDSQAKALVVLSNIAHTAAEILDSTQVEQVIVTNLADLHPWPKRQLINFVVKNIKKLVPKFNFPVQIDFLHTLAKSSASRPFSPVSVEPSTLMVLQYTGGTTGVSKGAMLSQGNLASNVWQLQAHLPEAFSETSEVYIACLPLYHIYALNLHALSAISAGHHNILIPNPRDLPSMVKALKSSNMTFFIGINTLFIALCRFPAFKALDFSRLKMTTSGGMALTEDAAQNWTSVTGCSISEGYGLTETSPVISSNHVGGGIIGSIGFPVPETDVILLDESGKEVNVGEVGELCARGPQLMLGYWNKPEETKQSMTDDGFFRTGDMATKDEHGAYRIVDRKKDMIIVSGFNVYPNEVEDVACLHPGVVEAAAVGVPDESSGEIVKLFVVLDDKSLTQEDIRTFCKTKLTGYKVPKIVVFRDELPKSNVGKILRRELRDGKG